MNKFIFSLFYIATFVVSTNPLHVWL